MFSVPGRQPSLGGTYLAGANLEDANVDDEQLAMCKSLEGATMPDRSKHDWRISLPPRCVARVAGVARGDISPIRRSVMRVYWSAWSR